MPEFEPISVESDELPYDAVIRTLHPVLRRPELYDLVLVINEIYEAALRDKADNE